MLQLVFLNCAKVQLVCGKASTDSIANKVVEYKPGSSFPGNSLEFSK